MVVGAVVSLWRYPVKSMMGEELYASEVTENGLLGDRTYAILDRANNKVASLKHPQKWRRIFDCRATYIEPPELGARLPPVRITFPDGRIVTSEDIGINEILSEFLERDVILRMPAPDNVSQEEYWPAIEGLAYQDAVTEEAMPARTFFDLAVTNVLTTSSIDRLRDLYPAGRFEARRFRPNIVVEPSPPIRDFVENKWIGYNLTINEGIRLVVTAPCPRCIMVTLPQGDLPEDTGILRTVAKHNEANLGVNAAVVCGGTVRRGDPVALD